MHLAQFRLKPANWKKKECDLQFAERFSTICLQNSTNKTNRNDINVTESRKKVIVKQQNPLQEIPHVITLLILRFPITCMQPFGVRNLHLTVHFNLRYVWINWKISLVMSTHFCINWNRAQSNENGTFCVLRLNYNFILHSTACSTSMNHA